MKAGEEPHQRFQSNESPEPALSAPLFTWVSKQALLQISKGLRGFHFPCCCFHVQKLIPTRRSSQSRFMLIYVSSSPPFLISTFVIRPSTSTDASSTVLWRFKLAEQRWAFKFHLVASYFLLSCFCTFSCAPVSRKYFHCNANSRYLWEFPAWRGARKWSELHHSSLIFNYLTTGACKSQLIAENFKRQNLF